MLQRNVGICHVVRESAVIGAPLTLILAEDNGGARYGIS